MEYSDSIDVIDKMIREVSAAANRIVMQYPQDFRTSGMESIVNIRLRALTDARMELTKAGLKEYETR